MQSDDALDQRPTGTGQQEVAGGAPAVQSEDDAAWLQLAKRNFEDSTNWMSSAVRAEWERNQAHFHGRHAPGSKFGKEAYRQRSKVFRPKTRMALRNGEAALAAAMFSTANLVEVEAEDDSDENSVASAAVNKALLQYRLTKSIPWFLTAIGAFQDGSLHGICFSYNYWDYQEIEYQVPVEQNGQSVLMESGEPAYQTVRKVTADKPCIDLVPPENIRFDPAADWRDPVNSSPYLIRLVPMHLSKAMEMMGSRQATGLKWRQLTKAQLLSSKSEAYDSTRQARNVNRPEAEDSQSGDNKLIWLHENFVRVGGEEYVYWTVGTEIVLSDPVPLANAYFHGKRPITFGYVVLESHRNYPSATASLIAPLVEAGNEIANQRFDNVQLVLNKRYFIRRGQQLDIDALTRNVPGGGVMVDDPEKDVRIVSTPDVTRSSYEEQDRIDVQIDEMSGTFSQSSVAQNNDLNKTLGGMKLVAGGASGISEYTIRTFIETWAESTLRQLMLLEQYYETSDTIVALCSKRANLSKQFSADQMMNDLLIRELVLNVNIGIGATNPQQKVERLMYGLNAVAQLPGVARRIKGDPVIEEVFGALGYKSAERFFLTEEEAGKAGDPAAEAEQLKQQNEAKKLENQRLQIDNERALREREIERREQESRDRLELERELGYADIAAREGLTTKQLQAKLQDTAIRDRTTRQTVAARETSRQNEMLLKQRMGSGI